MNVSKISYMNYPKNNVSFGMFEDNNARETVRKALGAKEGGDERYLGNLYFNLMDTSKFLHIRTDEKTGKVKGEFIFDKKFVETETGRKLKGLASYLSVIGVLDDLSSSGDPRQVGRTLYTMKQIEDGIDPLTGMRETAEEAAMKQQRDAAAREARIDNLAK